MQLHELKWMYYSREWDEAAATKRLRIWRPTVNMSGAALGEYHMGLANMDLDPKTLARGHSIDRLLFDPVWSNIDPLTAQALIHHYLEQEQEQSDAAS